MSTLLSKIRQHWLIILIILAGLIIRFYGFSTWQGFDYDQEINAWIAKSIVVDHKPVLIGPETSVGGMYVGPYFNYIIALFFALGHMDPAATIVLNILLTLATLTIFYLVAKDLFSNRVATIALTLYSFSLVVSGYDQTLWNPTPIPLVSLLFFYFLYRRRILSATIFLGAMFHLHFQAILLAAIFIIYLTLFNRKEIFQPKVFLGVIVIMGIFFAPLVLFDLRHNFLNAHHLVQFFFGGTGKTRTVSLSQLWQTANILTSSFRDLIYNGSNQWVRVLGLILPVGAFIHLIKNLKKNNFYKLFLVTLSVAFLAFALYKGPLPNQYYFLFLYPLFLLTLADWLAKQKAIIIIPFLLAFALWNCLQTITYPNDLSLKHKHQTTRFIAQRAGGKTFKVDMITQPGLNTGFKYLFWLEGKTPSFDYTARSDKSFKIIIPKTIARPGELTASFGAIGVVELPQ